jgi:hypothetical protein
MEVKIMTKWEKAKVFIAGAAVAILMMVLLGATNTNGIGRYQITSTTGTLLVIIDTTTGIAQTFKYSFNDREQFEYKK